MSPLVLPGRLRFALFVSATCGAILSLYQDASHAAEFLITAEDGHNEIVFASHAPLESFEGRTEQVHGTIRLDPQALRDSIEIYLEVNLASLDTGIDRRNQHMRENHLHTDKHPLAIFRGATLVDPPAQLGLGETTQLQGQGNFEMHGVIKDDLKFVVDLTLRTTPEGTKLEVQASFEIFLADFDIPRPKFLFVKLDERQEITVHLLAHMQTNEIREEQE